MNWNNSAARQIFDNWEVSTIITAESGEPFTVTTGTDNSLTGEQQDRPNLVGTQALSTSRPKNQKLAEYFNIHAYVANPIGTFGNLGRDTLIGPGLADVDFGIFKNFPMWEKTRLQIRFEAFNLFNRPNFGEPDSSLVDQGLGEVLSAVSGAAGAGRIIQIGGKFTF